MRQAGGTERRPRMTGWNLHDDLPLPHALARARVAVGDQEETRDRAIKGEHLARGPCSPLLFPFLFPLQSVTLSV
jgi:hypothetical protein